MKSSRRLAEKNSLTLCPCDSGAVYSACCALAHNAHPAPTAEALMRSRYSAYVLGLDNYLLQTWHADTRPATLNSRSDMPTKWLGLEVKRVVLIDECSATVEFVARYKVAGKAARMHELSRFSRVDNRWYYIDGVQYS